MINPNTSNYLIPEQGGSKIAVIGKPGTGKSTIIQSILFAKKHIFPIGTIFSGTEDSNHYYKKFFPDTFIYEEYDEDVISNIIKRQKISKEHLDNPWMILLIDDCTDNPALFKKEIQQGLYKKGRHWKMLYILSLQYCMDVNPAIRTNIDGVFILRETNLKNRKSLYENYAGIIPTFNIFCDIMDTITNDHTALYIHNAGSSNNYKDCIFWYKAKIPPTGWKFGSREFWDFHYERYEEK